MGSIMVAAEAAEEISAHGPPAMNWQRRMLKDQLTHLALNTDFR